MSWRLSGSDEARLPNFHKPDTDFCRHHLLSRHFSRTKFENSWSCDVSIYCSLMEGFVGIQWTFLLTFSKWRVLNWCRRQTELDLSVFSYYIFWIFVPGHPNSELFDKLISVLQYENYLWAHHACFPVASHNWYFCSFCYNLI